MRPCSPLFTRVKKIAPLLLGLRPFRFLQCRLYDDVPGENMANVVGSVPVVASGEILDLRLQLGGKMNLKIVVALGHVALLCACAPNGQITLYPRGGGELAKGQLIGIDRAMQVVLKGETYRGSYVRGSTVGFGMATGAGHVATGVSGGASNQYTAVLTNGKKAVRCDFMFRHSVGNGMCLAESTVYDLVIE